MKGRQILDGSLIANEIVNFVKEKKINLLLFKIDFEKAFDNVNWNFLLDTMSQMNFGTKWRNWISSCLSSSSVLVLVNGSVSKEFKMERGLRAPSSVISSIECRRRRFFGGYKENEKKIVGVHWQKVIADKKDEGLGIGSIKGKKFSLLGKWRWRFLNEKDALWIKVISKIYGSDGGFDVRRDLNKNCHVAERWSKIDDIWQGEWAWRRQPFGRALTDLSSLNLLITGLVLDYAIEHKWTWALEDSGIPSLFNPSLFDILMGSGGFIKDEGASRAFYGVCLTALWHIWNSRNKVSHATSLDVKNDYCNEDVFSVVQRVSLLWVSNRARKYRVSWNPWIHSPIQDEKRNCQRYNIYREAAFFKSQDFCPKSKPQNRLPGSFLRSRWKFGKIELKLGTGFEDEKRERNCVFTNEI
nr:RNA-directed DNA polymerase, eukaryota, reverse transcriptase zinc-binding domain protein [Tanacetum cinerariifolium]